MPNTIQVIPSGFIISKRGYPGDGEDHPPDWWGGLWSVGGSRCLPAHAEVRSHAEQQRQDHAEDSQLDDVLLSLVRDEILRERGWVQINHLLFR